MKRSILFIGIVLLSVLFALSSCDMILNAVYPEFNPENQGAGMGDNSIHISMTVNNLDVCMNSMKIALVPVLDLGDGTFELQTDKAWIQSFWCLNNIDYWFTNLGKNQYRIFTWLETNSDDNKPGADEPSGIGTISDPGYINAELFDFRNVTEPTTINAEAYLDNYSRLDFSWIEKWNEGATIVDNNFYLSGPYSIDRAWPTWVNFSISPYDPNNIVNSVKFKIMDGYYGAIEYNYQSDYQNADGISSFYLDFQNKLSPALADDNFWANYSYMIVQIIVEYASGASYQNELWISLYDSDGSSSTFYDFYLNTEFTNTPYGYAYVYLTDSTNGNTLFYNSAYLDSTGSYAFAFYGVEDPSGLDQTILIYLYDQYWNYIGYYTQIISGITEYSVTYYAHNDGTINTTSSTALYYDLKVTPQLNTLAPNGYAYVYLFDSATGSTLAYNSTYLDVNGAYDYFNFYGIYDPTGADQYIGVYIYDVNWNYLGYFTQTVSASHGTTINYYMYNDGTFGL